MKEKTISLEHASLSLAEWVVRARHEQSTFVVRDAAGPVARLVPALTSRCTAAELADVLGRTELSPEEARSWADDLRQARATLSVPDDKWQ